MAKAMNTNKLQSFAAEARTSLMKAVRARIDAALEPNSMAQSDNPRAYQDLTDEIKHNGDGEQGRAKTAERHAYRWFNRIIALRYMDANEFTSVHVVSGEELDNPNALPAVLSAAKRGEFDEEVFDSNVGPKTKILLIIQAILDGSKPSNDPQGDAYGLLLRAYCDYWHRFLPFMFDDAGAADEILMPADLLAKDSVLRKSVEAMSVEDCVGEHGEGTVEIIGWLYQFYISERKDEVMTGFKKSKKAGADEIPAATQLFTPDWIVRYLVQNTVGRLWTQNHPESQLHKNWEYYIEPPSDGTAPLSEQSSGLFVGAVASDSESKNSEAGWGRDSQEEVTAKPTEGVLKIDSPESLTVCDPACGSGHMLTYAFDLLYDIYDEAGYSANEIPGLILKHNLFGMEIDERAANLAAFALTMKARGKYRRFFRKGRQVQPNIQRIEKIEFKDERDVKDCNDTFHVDLTAEQWNIYENADVVGSLIEPDAQVAEFVEHAQYPEHDADFVLWPVFEKARHYISQTKYLSRKYAVVVANPPYMGSGNMGNELKKYVNDYYKEGKADLFAAFMLRNLQLIQSNALLGMITMQSWMFLSSFESLRKSLLMNNAIETMAHLGSGAFDSIGGEVVSTTAFTICRSRANGKGIYLRLVDVQGDDNQSQTCSEIIGSPLRGELSAKRTEGSIKSLLFTVNQQDFVQIPESPIAYWLSKPLRDVFIHNEKLSQYVKPRQGLATADNVRFVREWWEVDRQKHVLPDATGLTIQTNHRKWFAYNKGGDFRKWYGNREFVVNWENNGSEIRIFGADTGKVKSRPQNMEFYFLPSVSWSTVTSGDPSFRFDGSGFICDQTSGFLSYSSEEQCQILLAILNSSFAVKTLNILGSSIHYMQGPVGYTPVNKKIDYSQINFLVSASRDDWDSYEISWSFKRVKILDTSIVQSVLQKILLFESAESVSSVDRLNIVIPAYIGYCKIHAEKQRQREIKNNELVADAYGVRDEVPCDVPIERVSLRRNPAFAYPKNTPVKRDELMTRDIIKEIISYAVGCMLGRYSLDKPGLILASQGETLDDYHTQIPNPLFEPDSDNVIPITEDEWFEDDIVTRFRQFLSVVLDEQHLEENIAYIEQVLGESLRKYFVNDFYDDHVKMYKNRPIYWMYSSRTDKKGAFKALIYLHRYTPATTNNVLAYLRDFTAKLHAQSERLLQSDKPSEIRKGEKLQTVIKECTDYERDILYPLATRNFSIDLDDGVLVNYLRMGKALRSIPAIEKKRTTVQSWTWPVNPLGEQ